MIARLNCLILLLASGCASTNDSPPVVIARPVDASLPAQRIYVPIRFDLVVPCIDPVSGRRLITVGDWIEAAKMRAVALTECSGRLAEIGRIQGTPVR